jgi:hypothetical protein
MANSYAEEEDRINSALEAYNSGKNRNLSALAREYRVSYQRLLLRANRDESNCLHSVLSDEGIKSRERKKKGRWGRWGNLLL